VKPENLGKTWGQTGVSRLLVSNGESAWQPESRICNFAILPTDLIISRFVPTSR
jgi:hypothetical protein